MSTTLAAGCTSKATFRTLIVEAMKKEGELVREPGYPWILTAWGITGVDLAHEIHKRKVVVSTCTKCFCQHRPEVDCY